VDCAKADLASCYNLPDQDVFYSLDIRRDRIRITQPGVDSVGKVTLADKVVWITGASSGIGEALAYALSAHGAKLVLSARREDVLCNVRSKCAKPEKHLVQPLDMACPAEFEPALKTVLDQFGAVDVLVHCAGVSQRGTALKTELKVDRHLMEVNYLGPIALTKCVLPNMLERGTGHIVVVSSLLGKFSVPKRAAYSASKHALHGFFDALRGEVETQGIFVTLVCPGFIRTNASLNALEGDGTPHNKMDSQIADGLSSNVCAREIVRAIEQRRREVYICRKERMGLFLSRFAPGVFSRVTRLKRKK
jgi:dehydrogenase/reductase SDR family protein 7B